MRRQIKQIFSIFRLIKSIPPRQRPPAVLVLPLFCGSMPGVFPRPFSDSVPPARFPRPNPHLRPLFPASAPNTTLRRPAQAFAKAHPDAKKRDTAPPLTVKGRRCPHFRGSGRDCLKWCGGGSIPPGGEPDDPNISSEVHDPQVARSVPNLRKRRLGKIFCDKKRFIYDDLYYRENLIFATWKTI